MAQILKVGDYTAKLTQHGELWRITNSSGVEEGLAEDAEVMDFMLEMEAERIAKLKNEILGKEEEKHGVV